MQEVLRGASSAFVIRILGTLIGFAVSVVVAHLLGANGTGVYYLALSVAITAATVGRVGFDNVVVRFTAAYASDNEWRGVKFVNRIAFRVVSGASLLISLALFFAARWLAEDVFGKALMEVPFRIAAFSILPFSLAMIQAESLRGLKCIPQSQWIKTVIVSIGTLVLLCPLIRGYGANGAIAAYVAASFLSAILAHVLWRKALMRKIRFGWGILKRYSAMPLLRASWPLYVVTLTGLVMQQSGTVFLGIWGTTGDVGVFSIATRIATLLLFPLIAMISIVAPKLAEMHHRDDRRGMHMLALSSSRILTVFALPASVLVFFLADEILSLFGPSFVGGTIVLQVLIFGVLINASTGAVSELLMMSGFEKDCRNVNVVGAISILVLCVALISTHGALGAAIAVTIGVAGKNLLMAIMVQKRLGFWPVLIS